MILTAKPVVEALLPGLTAQTQQFIAARRRAPHLVVILMGNDPASVIYTTRKAQAAETVGFSRETLAFDATLPREKLFSVISDLNARADVDGILVQRPLPPHLDAFEISTWIEPEKDVDCFHPDNVGRLMLGRARLVPCTPAGIFLLMNHYGLSVAGKRVAVIGRSPIVGGPLAVLCNQANATVVQIHRKTIAPAQVCKEADFVFSAAGKAGLVTTDWIKPGAVVVDVGINRNPVTGRLCGDVDFDAVRGVASAITPVPGGIGPMTIHALLENTLQAATLRA